MRASGAPRAPVSGAHLGLGRAAMEERDAPMALLPFGAALIYPENLGVGRSHRAPEARAQWFRAQPLGALGRSEEAEASLIACADNPLPSPASHSPTSRPSPHLPRRHPLRGPPRPASPRGPGSLSSSARRRTRRRRGLWGYPLRSAVPGKRPGAPDHRRS